MEKAVEIKRRAQRCVQNGDLDGAIGEYQRLVEANDTDPYTYVLIADLLYKKGEQQQAADHYLRAADAYQRSGLYKNGIAVCKKLLRLSLAPSTTLKRLAALHAHDGLGAEAALYYMQYAEQMVRTNEYEAAVDALKKAWEASTDQVKALERLAEVHVLLEDKPAAARAMMDASRYYAKNGQLAASEQCKSRAREMDHSVDENATAVAAGSSADTGQVPENVVTLDDAPATPGQAPTFGELEQMADASPGASGTPASIPFKLESEDDGRGRAAAGDDASDVGIEPGYEAPDSANTIPRLETVQAQWSSATPAAPSLNFDAPGAPGSDRAPRGLAEVEKLLAEAQEHFKSGDREAASATLATAAETYEKHEQMEAAASVWRSLGKSAQAPRNVLERWYANCQAREDFAEAAHVACELGDRALNENERDEAEHWFNQAIAHDEGNELAKRRLARLAGQPVVDTRAMEEAAATKNGVPAEPEAEESAATSAESPAVPPAPEKGRVELAVGRGEAVSFDLGSLISEFQRGVEAQLSGDAQSHYDLGMAYREMGLLEQAVDSFRVAATDPAYIDRCAEMIGRCQLDQGRFDEAAEEFSTALVGGRLDPDTQVSIRYQLGLAYEAAGKTAEALGEFEGVYARQPNFPDVAMKIRVLKSSVGRS